MRTPKEVKELQHKESSKRHFRRRQAPLIQSCCCLFRRNFLPPFAD